MSPTKHIRCFGHISMFPALANTIASTEHSKGKTEKSGRKKIDVETNNDNAMIITKKKKKNDKKES